MCGNWMGIQTSEVGPGTIDSYGMGWPCLALESRIKVKGAFVARPPPPPARAGGAIFCHTRARVQTADKQRTDGRERDTEAVTTAAAATGRARDRETDSAETFP